MLSSSNVLMNRSIFFLFLFSVSFLFFVPKSHANAVLAQPFQPTAINRMVSSSSLVTASTRYVGVTAANQSVYAVRAVEVGKASVANAVRARAFNPWGFAVVAAITAAGYLMDDDDFSILSPAVPFLTLGQCGLYSGSISNLTGDACLVQARKSLGPTATYYPLISNSYYPILTDPSGLVYNAFYPYDNTNLPHVAPDSNPQPASDDELYQIFQNLSPAQQIEILTDPLTGFPDSTIPEFSDAGGEISRNWDANNDNDPATLPTPNAPEKTSTVAFPEQDPAEDLCKTYPNIIACQETGELPDPEEIATEEQDLDYDPVSMSSSASCPAPYAIGRGVFYEFTTICGFASSLKPIVVTFSLVVALYILVGFRK